MLTPETLLHDRYRIVQLVGQGGMGAVYEAVDERLRSPVALKQTLVTGETMARAFEREAQLLAGLRHQALPRVIDHFVTAEGQFLVMEFIPGQDLAAALVERGAPFPLAQVLAWADVLLDALDYLHGQSPPVIHRDIKPQNLKLTPRGEIVLLDFGLAKGSAALPTRAPTQAASLFGYTPQYAPLEQVQGAGTDPRADLYSLGATLYHLATGQPPADALTRATAVLNGRPDPLRPADELGLPAPIAGALAMAMALPADERFGSARAMRNALRQATEAGPTATLGATLVARQEPAANRPHPAHQPTPAPAAPPTLAASTRPEAASPTSEVDALRLPNPPAEPLRRPVPPPERRGSLSPLLIGFVLGLLVIGGGLWFLFGRGGDEIASAEPTAAPSADPREAAPTAAPTTAPPPPAAATAPSAAALDPGLPAASPTAAPPPEALNITNNRGRSDTALSAFDARGALHVVWEDTTPSGGDQTDLVARTRAADGTWSDVSLLSDGFDILMSRGHRLARRPDGAVCAFWHGATVSTNPNTLGVYLSCYEEAGWTPAERADASVGGNRREYQPAFLPDGKVVFLSIVSAGTLLFGPELELSNGFDLAYRPALAAGPDGSLHALWTDQSDPFTLAYRRSTDGGATWSEPEVLSQTGAEPGGVHSIVVDQSGAVHVAWVGGGIWHRRRAPDGAWSEPVEVTRGEDGSGSTTLGLDVGPDGLAHLAWQNIFVDYARETAPGKWTAPRRIAEAPGSGPGPTLSVDGAGLAHVVWQDEAGDDDLFYTSPE